MGTTAADHSARWLAAVQLKNSIAKYWRPRLNSTYALHHTKLTYFALRPELQISVNVQSQSTLHEAPQASACTPTRCPVPLLLLRRDASICRSMPAEEKDHLRRKLLDLIAEQDSQVRCKTADDGAYIESHRLACMQHWDAITMLVPNHMRLPVQQIALQLALTFAKVARLDYPSAWPSLFGMHVAQHRPICCRHCHIIDATLHCFCVRSMS